MRKTNYTVLFAFLITLTFNIFVLSVKHGIAQSGTYFTRTLTFSKSGSSTISFNIKGPVPENGQTEILVEIGTDSPGTALPGSNLSTLSFQLTNGTSPIDFPPPPSSGSSPPIGSRIDTTITGKTISFLGIDVSSTSATTTHKYTFAIIHGDGVASTTTETWTLTVNGFPITSSPPARAIVSVVSYAEITSLSPVGSSECPECPECPACPACPVCPVCPVCPECVCPICPYGIVDISHLLDDIFIAKWPWPPGPPDPGPLSPPIWKSKIPENYTRKFVIFKPTDEQGNFLGEGLENEIKFNIKNAEAVGPLFDNQNGEYIQLIEYKKGSSPKISAMIRERSSTEIPLEEPAEVPLLPWTLAGVSILGNVILGQKLLRQQTGRAQKEE